MKTSTQKRIARLSGLLLLSLLVVALVVPAAQAMRDFSGASVSSTSAGSGTISTLQLPTLAQVQQHQGAASSTSAGSGTVNAAQRQTTAQVQQAHNHYGPSSISRSGTVNAAQPASSGISSTTVWIAAVAVSGTLLIGAWALARRRRQREEAPACELSAAGC